MIKNILLCLSFIILSVNCSLTLPSQVSNKNTRFTITNKTSDMDIKVILGSSSVILEKNNCVQSDFGDLAQIQVSIKPSFIQSSWLEQCQNDSKCRFDEGAWFILCESGQCRQGYDQHYELQGSSTEDQYWTTTSKDPSQDCSSL